MIGRRCLVKGCVSVPDSEVCSFQGAICIENSILGPDEVFSFPRMSSYCKVAIHRFHSTCNSYCAKLCSAYDDRHVRSCVSWGWPHLHEFINLVRYSLKANTHNFNCIRYTHSLPGNSKDSILYTKSSLVTVMSL
jgi:hypothetical protein